MNLTRPQQYQIALITLGAVALFAIFRYLPTGTNLSHMDFRAGGKNAIEFCDPANPQFIPVVDVRSPVTMTLVDATPAVAGGEIRATLTLKTASGKIIAPEDLLVMHTRKLHLLIVDPTLADYQHVHPEPARVPGRWAFHFTPRFGGAYRIFADFTPVATGRGLYANAEMEVIGATSRRDGVYGVEQGARPLLPPEWTNEREGYRFTLLPAVRPVRARQPAELKFVVTRLEGGTVPMEPVMGAFAHLVAFDEARSGFAHLHPMETDLRMLPNAVRPTLSFKITIPRAGRYVIWSQVNLGGREIFTPFWFEVVP
ncbi:MAG: hypothetical protein EXS39_00370 [Opitutaceae bacterium]|nr:hypothetical protein [Opitutaceae bacterium]